jgi:SnoaL-like polyketide cyclase
MHRRRLHVDRPHDRHRCSDSRGVDAARDEADAWSDETIEITQVSETTDGAVIAQATVTRTLTGAWRSVDPRGQRVSKDHCTIFRFDADGRIVLEEQYEDALSVMRQLGAVPE